MEGDFIYEYTDWHNSLREQLYTIFSTILENEPYMKNIDIVNDLLNVNAMYIWGLAMTPVIYDIVENYELIELVGDAVMDISFYEYMIKKYPDYDEADITNLAHSYLSKEHQWKITIGLGLDKFVRLRYPGQYINNNILTDICEAFFGAIKKVGDMKLNGLGMLIAKSVNDYVFENIIEIDDDVMLGADKTQVQQIFSRFGLKTPIEDVIGEPPRVITTLTLTDEQMRFLYNNGIDMPSNIIADRVRGSTEDASTGKAYRTARINLASVGVTPEWATEVKTSQELANMDPITYQRALDRAKSDGMIKIHFDIPKKLDDFKKMTILLIGTRASDGRLVNLQDITVNSANNKREKKGIELRAKAELLNKYSRIGKYPDEVPSIMR